MKPIGRLGRVLAGCGLVASLLMLFACNLSYNQTYNPYIKSSTWCVSPAGFVTRKNEVRCRSEGWSAFSNLSAAKSYAASIEAGGEKGGDAKVPKRRGNLKITSTGSGFFVSDDGHLVTNNHVIEGCEKIRLLMGRVRVADVTVIGSDEKADLALLSAPYKPKEIAYFRDRGAVRSGDTVTALGYPLLGILGSQLKVSTGIVSATVGLQDDMTKMQISAPIQSGNSGGPVLDESGNIAGVVVSKLAALKIAAVTGEVPQNINFAVKESVVKALMTSFDVKFKVKGGAKTPKLADIVARAKKYTAVVGCWT